MIKPLLTSLMAAAALVATVAAQDTKTAGSFQGAAGLQLYSLREEFKKDVPGTLDRVKAYGVTEVETAGTYNMPAAEFRKMLDQRGLKATSAHFQYEPLNKDI